MRILTKHLNIFLVVAILLMSLCGAAPVSAQSSAGYLIDGTGADRDFTLNISVYGTEAYAGRIAIAFDTDMLELKNTDSVSSAVLRADGVSVTNEGIDPSVLLSNIKGYAMFAWHVSDNAPISAISSPVQVASIPFRIKPGYTVNDFSRNTFGIRYVNSSMLDIWDCGAMIIRPDLNAYTITAFDSDYLCNIEYGYPNCDYVPIVTYDTSIRVTDLYGNPINGASVMVDNFDAVTDASGIVSYQLADGTYGYRVEAQGYQTQTGYVTVKGAASSISVMLKSYAQMVQNTANNLEIEYAHGDDAANVTSGIGLPSVGENGETITWQSSNSSVVTNQGIVIRGNSDINVVMTATVSLGGASTVRSFNITVKSSQTVEQINKVTVRMDADALAIGYAPGDSAGSVTSDLNLPDYGSYGSGILWTSSNPDVINEYGMVERPAVDTNVTLTALIVRGDESETRIFNVTVKAPETVGKSDAQLVSEVHSALEIGYADGDSQYSVTKLLSLPGTGADGVNISWQSSEPAIVTAYGGVVRQFGDCNVTLTATVSKGDASMQKVFNIVVKAAEVTPINPDDIVDLGKSDAECVALDKNAARIIFAPGDSSESVTANITLPASGENGSSIFWDSSNLGVISAYGSVTRPSSDTAVTMTAIISKGNASETVSFNLTVKGTASVLPVSDNEIVQTVADALEILYAAGDSANRVTKSVTLPTIGANDTVISWTSSNPNVIGTNGGVTRKNVDMSVTLTAVVSRGSANAQKKFTLTVPAAQDQSASSIVNGEGDINQLLPTQNPMATPSSQERFIDLGTVPWARDSILALANLGVINGTSANQFSPDAQISRGDFITLLVRMLQLDGELGEGFADVPQDMYYYEPITVAKTMGVITGIGNNMFDPEGSISRQDMMTMTYRALSQLGMADFQQSDLSSFNDTASVADYAWESVSHIVGGGLIAGDENGNLNPEDNTTRAETAVFLYRLYLNNNRG